MLDPALVRDHMDLVRTGLQNRGLERSTPSSTQLATLETRRRAAAAAKSRVSSGSRTRPARRSRARSAQGLDPSAIFAANKARAQQIVQLEAELDEVEQQRTALLHDAAEPAARERAGRRVRRGQSGSPAPWRPAGVRLRAETALGPRAGARHPRLRARHAHVGRAVLRAARRRRAARARADQLHARAPHAGARLHRSGAAVPRQRRRAARHRQPAEVRAGSVQDRRRLGSLPDPDRGSAADEPASDRDPRRPAAAAALHRLHAVLPQRSRARTAPTSAG